MADNKEIAARFYQEINKGNLAVIDELVADNFVDHEEMPGMQPGKEGVKQWMSGMLTAFPDFHMEATDIMADGDRVCILAKFSGTHQGDFMGIPATGKKIDVPVADVVRFADGKAVEHWGVTDTGLMMQQLGVIDEPGEIVAPGADVTE